MIIIAVYRLHPDSLTYFEIFSPTRTTYEAQGVVVNGVYRNPGCGTMPDMLRHFFVNAWRWASGLPEIELNGHTTFNNATQWCPEFEACMRRRLLVGAYRYGPMKAPGKPFYDRITAIHKRLDAYVLTGNAENLVDSANLLMLEFAESRHPNFHFASSDDGEHVAKL